MTERADLMFYILILIGAGALSLGFYNKKNTVNLKPNDAKEYEDAGLAQRLEAIEAILFESMMTESQKSPEGNSEPKVISNEKYKEESENIKKNMPDNIKLILDYEKRGLDIQQIVKKTGMNKGEVLLLKDLSKNYLK